MAVKIRLSRGGTKKRPYFYIVVADSASPRDGRYIEQIGTHNPLLPKDSADRVKLDLERAKHWLAVGAHYVKADACERALDPLRQAIEIEPTLADAERTLAAALDRLGRAPEAAEHFRRYLELAPGAADAASVREHLTALEKKK